MDTGSCREARYDAVLHLVTAASGAEAFYSLGNNAARTEVLLRKSRIISLPA
jgi:hypothetical protein